MKSIIDSREYITCVNQSVGKTLEAIRWDSMGVGKLLKINLVVDNGRLWFIVEEWQPNPFKEK